jgi:hypothetical protein
VLILIIACVWLAVCVIAIAVCAVVAEAERDARTH